MILGYWLQELKVIQALKVCWNNEPLGVSCMKFQDEKSQDRIGWPAQNATQWSDRRGELCCV